MSPLRRIEHWLIRINQLIVFAAMLVVLVFTFGQAVDRYAIHSSFDAHDQIAKVGLVWLVFAGMAVAYAQRENLRIDLISKYLPPAVVRWRDALFELAILGVCVLVNVKGWAVLEVVAFQQIMGTPLTNAVPYSAILVGTAAIAFTCMLRLIDALTGQARAMTLLIIVLFLVLLVLGMDVGFAMVLAAVAGILTRPDAFNDAVMLPLTMLTSVDSAALLSIPLFILAGELMNSGGVTQRLINWSLAFVGHFRGALSQVAVVTNLIMAGISGSAVADATATGTALIPAMKRAGYHEGYAGAVIAAAAMLGPILPPSIPMVVYAVMANHSVIKIFLGGVIPAFMLAAGYMGVCAWIARRRNYPAQAKSTWPQRWQATRDSGWALAMPVIVLAGIRFGIVTDIEAAAAIAMYALFVGWAIYRELDRGKFLRAILDSGRSSAVILFLLAAAGPFGWLLSEAKVNQGVRDLLLSISTDPLIVLLLINVFLLLIGKILEPLPAMIIFVPTLLPVAAQLHIDPTHFAIIVVLNLMIGLQTPPVGLLLFVSSAVGREPIGAIIMQIIPFVLWSLTVLALVVIFPPLATWLPNL